MDKHLACKVLNLFGDAKKGQKLYYSENTPYGGILYWLSNEKTWEEKVKEIEQNYNITVYHCIHTYTEFGELLDMLYYENDEDIDCINIFGDGYIVKSYCWNITDDMLSEFGDISVKNIGGGLKRLY